MRQSHHVMYRTDMPLRLAVDHLVWGTLSSHDLPAIASAAIDQGFFSASLAELALTERPIASEAEPLFVKALEELGMDLPDKVHAGRRIAGDYARRILEGEIPVHEGARSIWLDIAINPEWPHKPSLETFVYGACEWDDVVGTPHQHEFEQGILEAARDLLRQITA
jgi:hypothetical protein